MAKIPARYIGQHEVVLSKQGGPYFDGSGARLTDFVLRPGSTLLMNEEEVLGSTFLLDPRHLAPAENLGPGRVVKPEHKGLSDAELAELGYQFHTGRSDFEAIKVTAPLGDEN
jgi:hypothetical protein